MYHIAIEKFECEYCKIKFRHRRVYEEHLKIHELTNQKIRNKNGNI